MKLQEKYGNIVLQLDFEKVWHFCYFSNQLLWHLISLILLFELLFIGIQLFDHFVVNVDGFDQRWLKPKHLFVYT